MIWHSCPNSALNSGLTLALMYSPKSIKPLTGGSAKCRTESISHPEVYITNWDGSSKTCQSLLQSLAVSWSHVLWPGNSAEVIPLLGTRDSAKTVESKLCGPGWQPQATCSYWTLKMWLVQTEMCCKDFKDLIHTGLQKLVTAREHIKSQ